MANTQNRNLQHPNLLFIYTDAQHAGTMAAYGNDTIDMPNLNKLAETSTVFERAYVTQPVCTPSRSTILTGTYPHTNGCTRNNIPLRRETQCLPEMIQNGDYVTGHFGKWHLGDEVFSQHGFDNWVSIEDAYRQHFSEGRDKTTPTDYYKFLDQNGMLSDDAKARFKEWPFALRRDAAEMPEEFSRPAFLGTNASNFIKTNQDSPFMLHVNFLSPHPTYDSPRRNQYDPADMPLPKNFENVPEFKDDLSSHTISTIFRKLGDGSQKLETREDWQKLIALYWGSCSLVDTHIGKILDTLRECNLWDNTIIVFTSDHGNILGGHRLLEYSLMWEEAVRVPYIIHLPGQQKERRVQEAVSSINIVPTLLDIMGQPIPEHLQGKSLLPVLSGEETKPWSEDVFIEWDGLQPAMEGTERIWDNPEIADYLNSVSSREDVEQALGATIRTIITPDGWKFIFKSTGQHQLFNLSNDPGETSNLAYDTEYLSIMKELHLKILAWQTRTDDDVTGFPTKVG